MSHSIITLKLILATAEIIDPLNVCHSAPVNVNRKAVNKHAGPKCYLNYRLHYLIYTTLLYN